MAAGYFVNSLRIIDVCLDQKKYLTHLLKYHETKHHL
jgi:hypothetical protein